MKLRKHYLKHNESISDSQTVITDIDITNPISAIDIIYEATTGSTSCQNHTLFDDVSKIELVDGGATYLSDTMKVLSALCAFRTGRFPYHSINEGASKAMRCGVRILFGRYLGDMDYFLDPKEYTNLQLLLTHSLTISATAGFATGTGKLNVIAHIFKEGTRGKKGTIFSKEIKSFTSASSGEEEVDITTKDVFLGLIIQALLSTYRPDEIITKVKLSFDEDSYKDMELDSEDILAMNRLRFGLFDEIKTLLQTDGDGALFDLFDIQSASLSALNDLDVASYDALDSDKVTLQLLSLTTSPSIAKSSTDTAIQAKVSGFAPFACLFLPH